MANKYIIHGATYNGDGTSSAAAASNGGVGAWNTITYFEGTTPAYGTLVAGDTVFIRSKDASGNAITRTLSANMTLGTSAAISTAWVKWVVDGGTVWAGISGTLTYSCPLSYAVTFRNYNHYAAEAQDALVIVEANTSSDYKKIVTWATHMRADKLFVNCSANTHSTGNHTTALADGGETYTLTDLHLKWANHLSAVLMAGQWSNITLINPQIELTKSDANAGVFELGEFGSRLTVIGGRVFGVGATTGNSLVMNGSAPTGRGGTARFVGFTVPKAMQTLKNHVAAGSWRIEGLGMDDEEGGVLAAPWGTLDSRLDGYYPTLNAFLPDSVSTPWSWKLYPVEASNALLFSIPVAKEFTESDAVKTLTVNMLLADTITAANKSTMWMTANYIDASTGESIGISTQTLSDDALDSSSANWSATTYGAINLVKKQLSITTPTSIKQNTMVVLALCGTWKAASALDIAFVCPDVVFL